MKAVLQKSGDMGKTCLLFPDAKAAQDCKSYVTSPDRGADALIRKDIVLCVFDVHVRLFAVIFTPEKLSHFMPFWNHTGSGISSRLAEDCLQQIDLLNVVHCKAPPPVLSDVPAQTEIRRRIAGLLERAPVVPRHDQVSPDDVYLFQTGMSARYHLQNYLREWRNSSTSVLIGPLYHSTVELFRFFEPGCKLLGLGSNQELDELEEFCKSEANHNRQVQTVWTEVPCNPLLGTADDLLRLRKLADTYHFILVVDDTIGSFCNIDLLSVADIIVTSLTETFSGSSNVMAGSIVLNPSTPLYATLKTIFQTHYENLLYNSDATVLEENSRDYLTRSLTLNSNTEQLQ